MASTIYSNAARIIKQVFDWMQTSQEGKTGNLIVDSFSSGINNATPSGEGFLVVPGTNNTSVIPTVNVSATSITPGGIAYDPLGNRVSIDVSDVTLYNPSNVTTTTNDGLGVFIPTAQSSGVVNIPVGNSGTITYIWINYLATIDTTAFTLNKETNAKIFFKSTDGYNIQTVQVAYSVSPPPPVPPDANSIFLAAVTMPTGPVAAVAPSNISQVGRSFYQLLPNIVPITTPLANASDRTPTYAAASTYTLTAHIKSVGTGTGVSPFNPHNMSLGDLGVSSLDLVTGHRQLEHSNAIIAGTVGNSYPVPPTPSAMYCGIGVNNPGSDYIIVSQLLSSQVAIVNGSGYSNTQIFGAVPADAIVLFPNTTGTYNVYWDSITKSFAVTTGTIAADVTKLWLCTVTYTYVGTGPSDHNALSALIERRRIGSTVEKYQRWTTTARPPVPLPGEYGFNIDINAPEWFDGTSWQSLNAPTGAVIDFAGPSAPLGWLVNDGSVISQTTYANLYAVIGIAFNTGGEGAGNFRLPNKQRRTSVGAGGTGSGTLGNTVGSTGGEETHVLITAELASHGHTASVTDPGHLHRFGHRDVTGSFPQTLNAFRGDSSDISNYFETDTRTTGISVAISSTGSGTAHNNIQPSIIFTSIIKF